MRMEVGSGNRQGPVRQSFTTVGLEDDDSGSFRTEQVAAGDLLEDRPRTPEGNSDDDQNSDKASNLKSGKCKAGKVVSKVTKMAVTSATNIANVPVSLAHNVKRISISAANNCKPKEKSASDEKSRRLSVLVEAENEERSEVVECPRVSSLFKPGKVISKMNNIAVNTAVNIANVPANLAKGFNKKLDLHEMAEEQEPLEYEYAEQALESDFSNERKPRHWPRISAASNASPGSIKSSRTSARTSMSSMPSLSTISAQDSVLSGSSWNNNLEIGSSLQFGSIVDLSEVDIPALYSTLPLVQDACAGKHLEELNPPAILLNSKEPDKKQRRWGSTEDSAPGYVARQISDRSIGNAVPSTKQIIVPEDNLQSPSRDAAPMVAQRRVSEEIIPPFENSPRSKDTAPSSVQRQPSLGSGIYQFTALEPNYAAESEDTVPIMVARQRLPQDAIFPLDTLMESAAETTQQAEVDSTETIDYPWENTSTSQDTVPPCSTRQSALQRGMDQFRDTAPMAARRQLSRQLSRDTVDLLNDNDGESS